MHACITCRKEPHRLGSYGVICAPSLSPLSRVKAEPKAYDEEPSLSSTAREDHTRRSRKGSAVRGGRDFVAMLHCMSKVPTHPLWSCYVRLTWWLAGKTGVLGTAVRSMELIKSLLGPI